MTGALGFLKTRLRPFSMFLGCLLATAVYLEVVSRHQPLEHWFTWQILALWFAVALFATASLALGHVVLARGLRMRLPLREHLALSFPMGVLGFATGIFIFGITGALRPWLFYGWPGLLLAGCGPVLVIDVRKWLARWRRLCVRLTSTSRGSRALTTATWIFGAAGFALVYAQILATRNIAYDAHWYHLGLAERYAVTGAIQRTPEGWFQGTLPQLATWLFTWAMLIPKASLAFKLRLVGHIEFVLLMAIAASIPLLCRHLSKGKVARHTWPAIFLFPGIFLYDSNLNGSADHVHAFWAIPIALSFRRLTFGADWKAASLFGALVGGAIATKYQASYFLAALTLLSSLQLVRGPWRARGALSASNLAFLKNTMLAAGVCLLVTSPHWLKNLVFHGNPLYPFAHELFGGHPWEPGTTVRIEDPGWRPTGTSWEQVKQTLVGALTFSLSSHDWPTFHEDQPVFGALFPLALIPILAVPFRTHRLWSWSMATFVGVATWFWTYHQDRYLQALLPWMAAIAATALGLLWQARSVLARAGVFLLVGFQLIWGADIPFFPTHAMVGGSIYSETLRLASSSFRDAPKEQHDPATILPDVRKKVPKGAVLLVHEKHALLGLGRRTISDTGGRQGGIVYQNLTSARAVHDKLKSLGVTHLMWTDWTDSFDTFASDLVFYGFARLHAEPRRVHDFNVAELPPAPPPEPHKSLFAVAIDCEKRHVFDSAAELNEAVPRLRRDGCSEAPPGLGMAPEALAKARFIVVSNENGSVLSALQGQGYRILFERNGWVALSLPSATRRPADSR